MIRGPVDSVKDSDSLTARVWNDPSSLAPYMSSRLSLRALAIPVDLSKRLSYINFRYQKQGTSGTRTTCRNPLDVASRPPAVLHGVSNLVSADRPRAGPNGGAPTIRRPQGPESSEVESAPAASPPILVPCLRGVPRQRPLASVSEDRPPPVSRDRARGGRANWEGSGT